MKSQLSCPSRSVDVSPARGGTTNGSSVTTTTTSDCYVIVAKAHWQKPKGRSMARWSGEEGNSSSRRRNTMKMPTRGLRSYGRAFACLVTSDRQQFREAAATLESPHVS